MRSLLLSSLGVMLSIGCSTSTGNPVLYPNERYQRTSEIEIQNDTERCKQLAGEYVSEPSRYQGAARGALVGGAVGAGSGALAGTITKGNVGRATGAGAAVGSILGIANELRQRGEPNPSYRQFVDHCLQREGYEVVTWE